jgi:hypothetical protein
VRYESIKIEDYLRGLAERKAALGIKGNDYVPLNSGVARTPMKRELLRLLALLAREQGREPPFKANY